MFLSTIQKQIQSYRHKTVSHSLYLWYPLFSYTCLLIFNIYPILKRHPPTYPSCWPSISYTYHKIAAATWLFCVAVIATYSTSLSLCVRADYHAEDVDVYASLYDYITAYDCASGNIQHIIAIFGTTYTPEYFLPPSNPNKRAKAGLNSTVTTLHKLSATSIFILFLSK